jgi:DNA-binding NtrC family response regulator
MQRVYRMVRLVAPRTTTVLIAGPTGSGKELVACGLANCLRRVVALATSTEIDVTALEDSDWDLAVPASTPLAESRLRPGVSLGEMERKLFEMTLESTGGNRSHAAELLGVSLRTVRNKIRSYGLPSCSSYVHD